MTAPRLRTAPGIAAATLAAQVRWWRRRKEVTSAPLLAVFAVTLMAATDLKVRVRTPTGAVTGSFDVWVLAEVALFAAVAVVVIGLYPGRSFRAARISLVPALAALFVADLLLSATYSPFAALAGVRGCELLVWCVLALQLGEFGGLSGMHRLAHGFIVLVSVAVSVGFVFHRPAVGLERDRFSWLSVHPVVAASWLGISATLLLAYLLSASGRHRVGRWHPNVYLLLLVTHVVALIATGTRGALIGLVCSALTVVAGQVRARRRIEFLAVATVLGVTVWLTASGPVQDFIARGEGATRLSTLNGRTHLWHLAWTRIQERPWFGHGLAASRGLFLDRTSLGGAHNAAMNVLVDQGVVGLALFGMLCLVLLVSLTRLPSVAARAQSLPARGVLVFLIVDGLTVEYMAAPVMAAFDWFLLIAVWARLIHRRADKDSPLEEAD